MAFGQPALYDLVNKALMTTDCYSRDNGSVYCRFPGGRTSIPRGSYPVYWAMSVCDFFWSSGNVSAFEMLLPDVKYILDQQAKHFDSCLNYTCDFAFIGWDDRVGIGWSDTHAAGGEAFKAFAGLIIQAFREVGACLTAASKPKLAKEFSSTASRLAMKFRSVWSVNDLGLHSAAHAINAGIMTKIEAQQLVSQQFNDSVTICSLSPFNTYYIVQALANTGHHELALAAVNRCWGGITRLGHGCMWELFDPEWENFMHPGEKAPSRPSFCHPWSSGATAFLSKFILGVTASQPGFMSVDITPFVSAAYPTVQGTVPVVHGTHSLTLEAKYSPSSATSNATVHVGLQSPVHARAGFPLKSTDGCSLQNILVDGVVVAVHVTNRTGTQPQYGYTSPLPPGNHSVDVSYGSCSSSVRPPTPGSVWPFPDPPVYPIPSMTIDRDTRGNWTGRYGKDGYILFGFYPCPNHTIPECECPKRGPCPPNMGMDMVSFPPESFLHDITPLHGCGSYPVPVTDTGRTKDALTLLTNPSSGERGLGHISGGGDGSQGTYIDVNTKVGVRYELAVYLVASCSLSKTTPRIMDLETLNPLTPGMLIDDYENGVWLVMEYDRPLRVQLISIDGIGTASAVMISRH